MNQIEERKATYVRFPYGRIVATRRILEELSGLTISRLLMRHLHCDWGDICDKDWKLNAREPVWSREGKDWGENNDIGDTYIEVDMGAQHMWAYKDGALVIDTDVVTGNISRHYGTPAIVAQIQYKDRNAVLRGDNYATPVKYWMPFYGNYGIHDASWRREFGGTVYLTNGSHGCVNTPPAAMKVIFETMDSGTPVVLYY